MRFVKPRLEALRRIQVLTTEKRGVEPRDDFVEVLTSEEPWGVVGKLSPIIDI